MQNIHVSKSSGFSNFPFPSIFKIFLLVEKYLRNCLKPKYFFENCLPKTHRENIHERKHKFITHKCAAIRRSVKLPAVFLLEDIRICLFFL